jgi:hypothetical protein
MSPDLWTMATNKSRNLLLSNIGPLFHDQGRGIVKVCGIRREGRYRGCGVGGEI